MYLSKSTKVLDPKPASHYAKNPAAYPSAMERKGLRLGRYHAAGSNVLMLLRLSQGRGGSSSLG